MYVPDPVVLKQTRNYFQDLFKIADNYPYWAQLGYLAFNAIPHSRDETKVAAPFDLLRNLGNCQRIPAIEILKDMQGHGLIGEVIDNYSYFDRYCRAVELTLPPQLQEMIRNDQLTRNEMKKDPVFFSDGSNWNKYRVQGNRKEHKLAIQSSELSPGHPLRHSILDQLHNNRVLNWQLERMNKVSDEISATIDAMDDRLRQETAARIYNGIKDDPYIGYKGVDRSPRIYSSYPSILYAPREIKTILFRGTHSLDIQSCQIAITSSTWGLPQLKEFVASGGSIWDELMAYTGAETKDPIKDFVNPLVFMAGMTKLNEYAAKLPCSERIFSHPFIQEILEGRKRQMALLNGQGYLVDAFGRKLYISCNRRDNVNLNWWEQSEKSKRSIISQVVQSYEATVMEQIFDVLQD
ncbi:MAG: hypothetical protein WCL39_02780, partial [Armatimonadota bacterium]